MSGIFNATAFNNSIFNTGDGASTRPPRPADNERGRRIVKPLGLPPERRKSRSEVDDRVADSARIEAEIATRLAREFEGETRRIEHEEQKRISQMTQAEIDFEIGVLLRKKIRNQEDELLLLLMMVAAEA